MNSLYIIPFKVNSARRTSLGSESNHRRFHLVYAFPAWWGFAGEGDRQRLGLLLSRMRRGGYLPSEFPTIESLVDEADRKLFRSTSQNRTHVLRHLFTVKPSPTRPLRARAHNFILPLKDNRNFVSMALYNALCPPSG